jgi:hypothetical protein
MSTLRLLLVAFGLLGGVIGLTMRPADWRAWAVAAVAAWLAVGGLPGHWDSARLVAGVLGTLGVVGCGLVVMPPHWRAVVLSAAILFHFGGILAATTWPETYTSPSPWLTNQAANRIYLPYYKFMYLINAYHFYSPDPGPSSHLFFLIEYDTDEDEVDAKTNEPKVVDGKVVKKKAAEWVDIPRRSTQFRDPLGMTYYRRLSLTELVSSSTPGSATPASVEKLAAMQRRRDNEIGLNGKPIPGALLPGNELDLNQYRPPHSHLRRHTFPSYARHIASEYSGPRKTADGKVVNYTVTGVHLFRVEHRVVMPMQFLEYDNPVAKDVLARNPNRDIQPQTGGYTPNHPITYLPYYLGRYDPSGRLTNPEDPLLYWLVPIAQREKKGFHDWMSEYVGHEFVWDGKE